MAFSLGVLIPKTPKVQVIPALKACADALIRYSILIDVLLEELACLLIVILIIVIEVGGGHIDPVTV